MIPRFNLFSNYSQFNHLYAPKYFDWVRKDPEVKGGCINFFADDFIKHHNLWKEDDKPSIAMLIEPRTIQPTVYKWVEEHYNEFDAILTHDDKILNLYNAHQIYFMNYYKAYDVPKTKAISMVCSNKALCNEHRQRQRLADKLGDKVDHYGTYKGTYSDYYDCRAEYMFEVVVDNCWDGYWVSEKLMNPLASKTIPIYKGAMKGYMPDWLDKDGVIFVNDIKDIQEIVDEILKDPEGEYKKRLTAVEKNYDTVTTYSSLQVFENWLWFEYESLFEDLVNGKLKCNK